MNELDRYKTLQASLDDTNSRVSVAVGRKQEVARQLKTLFDKHGVTKLSELQAKTQEKKAEVEAVAARAQTFVTEQQAKLNQVETILMKEPEHDIIGSTVGATAPIPTPALASVIG